MEFTVVQGDIAAQSADALVNAAGTSLRMGSGVAGFDLLEGARLIAEEIRRFDPDSLRDVRFVAHSDEEYRTVRETVDAD